MTDMTDFSETGVERPKTESRFGKAPKSEFMCYFALIFVATLPLSILTWILGVARTGSFNRANPVKSAWSQARIITPRIFSA